MRKATFWHPEKKRTCQCCQPSKECFLLLFYTCPKSSPMGRYRGREHNEKLDNMPCAMSSLSKHATDWNTLSFLMQCVKVNGVSFVHSSLLLYNLFESVAGSFPFQIVSDWISPNSLSLYLLPLHPIPLTGAVSRIYLFVFFLFLCYLRQ